MSLVFLYLLSTITHAGWGRDAKSPFVDDLVTSDGGPMMSTSSLDETVVSRLLLWPRALVVIGVTACAWDRERVLLRVPSLRLGDLPSWPHPCLFLFLSAPWRGVFLSPVRLLFPPSMLVFGNGICIGTKHAHGSIYECFLGQTFPFHPGPIWDLMKTLKASQNWKLLYVTTENLTKGRSKIQFFTRGQLIFRNCDISMTTQIESEKRYAAPFIDPCRRVQHIVFHSQFEWPRRKCMPE